MPATAQLHKYNALNIQLVNNKTDYWISSRSLCDFQADIHTTRYRIIRNETKNGEILFFARLFCQKNFQHFKDAINKRNNFSIDIVIQSKKFK